MLKISEYLISLLQMEDITTASKCILGEETRLEESEEALEHVLKTLCVEMCPQLKNYSIEPMAKVLEAFDDDSFLSTWDNLFSIHLSDSMHLFGTTDPAELETHTQKHIIAISLLLSRM